MSFKDIIGQDRQITAIKKAIEKNRVPHAFLFLGEEGIGKRLTAITLAKALNCSTKTDDACDLCGACRKITHGNHPDVTVIEPEGNFIKIHQVRELQRTLQYKPYEGEKKVCIIPDAEKMNQASASSLLKTLEEPPPNTIIILITTSPHLLLPTVSSRCQRLNFQPLTPDFIARVIKERLGKEEETAFRMALLARGSLKRAYDLAEGTTIEHRNHLIRKLHALSSDDFDNIFKLAEEMSQEKDELIDTLEFLMTWFRDLLVYKENCPQDRLINFNFLQEIKEAVKGFTSMEILEKFRIISDAKKALLMNSNKRLTLEVMLTRLYHN